MSSIVDHPAHKFVVNNLSLWNALEIGLGTLTFYSIPDLIKSKPGRFFAKTLALGIPLASQIHQNVSVLHKEGVHLRDVAGVDFADAEDVETPDPFEVVAETAPGDPLNFIELRPTEDEASTANLSTDKSLTTFIREFMALPPEYKKPIGIFAGAVGTVGLTVVAVGETLIYRRAERKKAAGVKNAHIKQAAKMAALGVLASVAVDQVDRFKGIE
ncbi:MAG: hypothetical protein WBH82_01605 [Arcanobacterium sp.]